MKNVIDILYKNVIVIVDLPRTIQAIFTLLLIFCCCFTCLKACKISRQNIRKSENIGHVVNRTVQVLKPNFLFFFVFFSISKNLHYTNKQIQINLLKGSYSKFKFRLNYKLASGID